MKELFIGSDASKGYCDFVILDSDEKVVLENFQLDDTAKGHTQLRTVIDGVFNEDIKDEDFRVLTWMLLSQQNIKREESRKKIKKMTY